MGEYFVSIWKTKEEQTCSKFPGAEFTPFMHFAIAPRYFVLGTKAIMR